ncbi:hypothetical protein DSM112329_00713 [Paraconexibacter sp. AEG42_29]|uniref:SGNH hydrolase-type esterase domain-containing protein n=1 Tax=Paraconexibacter sp. AEG42_29 TaxID=2997339 RepID=A0AAU7AQW6_9ACTN
MADDDALMDRFEQNSRRFNARDAIITVFVCAFVLVLINGNSMKNAGERLEPGVQRTAILAVAKPAGWLADQLPFHDVAHDLTAGLSPDEELSKKGGFDQAPAAGAANQVPLVTPAAFDPAAIGAKPAAKLPLKKLLVTGDSLSDPLDKVMARDLASAGVDVDRKPVLGSGISKTDLVEWGRLSATQKENIDPDAVIMFMGANEGFPMKNAAGKDVECCGADWAAIYANRVRQMMNTYRAGGKTHIYWVKLPTQRQAARQKIAKVVNAAIEVAAQPYRNQVTVFDTLPTFTPGDKYRDAMDIDGKKTIVRREDGIHLNDEGADLLGELLIKQLQQHFDF